MAGGVDINVAFPDLQLLKDSFKTLPKTIAAKHMAAALGKAIEPGLKALRRTTPRGPTGNLKRAIRKKTKRYISSGSGVALAGFTAAPRKKAEDLKSNQKGYHQGLVEFGTKKRFAKKKSRNGLVIASSYKRKEFAITSGRGGKLRTPKNSFFRSAPANQKELSTGQMPVGGRFGKPPVRTAFEQTLPQMRSLLPAEMTKALNNALRDKADRYKSRKKVKP
jgi:hypothetical protein